MSIVIVTTTVDSEAAAQRLSRAAVEVRLAACGQVIGPITSTYWWEGEIETAQEWTVAFKTIEAAAAALIDQLKEDHPYDVPEVLVAPVTVGNPAYLGWVEAETRVR
jgi:periplasmic divalent cation tolerance protein